MPNDHVKGAGAANEFDKYKAKKTGISDGLAKGHVVTKRAVVREHQERTMARPTNACKTFAPSSVKYAVCPHMKNVFWIH